MITKVACGVIKHNDKYFVAKRPNFKYMGGKWEFPGGKVEEGEFESECLHRELWEELGIRIIIFSEYMPLDYNYPKFTIELHAFKIDIIEGEISLKEHTESGFFKKEELLKMDLTPPDRILVEKYL